MAVGTDDHTGGKFGGWGTSVDASVESGRWRKRAAAVRAIDIGRVGVTMFVFGVQ